MDLIDKIQELATRLPKRIEHCSTEEATKNALILPFISALGYDMFDPTEVVPEFTADIGTKKGEKVDYAIMKNGNPIIFFECKWSGADLNQDHMLQLFRYFSAIPEIRFGILTNGVVYRFYSDLESPNRIDDKPFFEFNILDYQERDVNELKKFSKSTFDLEKILMTANELKYTAAIQRIISQEFEQPSDDFVRFFAGRIYSGRITQAIRDQFEIATKKALKIFLSDSINERQSEDKTKPSAPNQKSYTGSKPRAYMIKNQRYEADKWIDVMLGVCEFLRLQDQGLFEQVASTLIGRKRPYITSDKSKLREAEAIPKTNLYLEKNLNTNQIVSLCYQLMEAGYSRDDLTFEVV